METGKPISLLASAAGSTLLFKPPHEDVDPSPSSIWHKQSAAAEAGRVTKTSAGTVEPVRKP
jgi:hypothetical protein